MTPSQYDGILLYYHQRIGTFSKTIGIIGKNYSQKYSGEPKLQMVSVYFFGNMYTAWSDVLFTYFAMFLSFMLAGV